MGSNTISWTYDESVKTSDDVRKRLMAAIDESAHRDGHLYSGEIGSLFIGNFNFKEHETLSEEEFNEKAFSLQKRSGLVTKVKVFDKNKDAAVRFGNWALHCLSMDTMPNPLNKLSFSEGVGPRDRKSIEKILEHYLAAADEMNKAKKVYHRLVNIVSDVNSDEKFTATEIKSAKLKYRVARTKLESRLTFLRDKAQEIDDKLQPKTFKIVWGVAACCPS